MDIDICPPYWPSIIWWLIHHPHGPGPIDKQLVSALDSHFAAITVSALAGRLGDAKVAQEVAGLSGKLASNPVAGLQGFAK